ncbi:hypothetical protein, partial [Micromonospora sp. RP3T]|uniref:hypothetical protein n=1 Tax=Micromonospora sp. RP3T TaxID=2135446 RepID=UPI001E58EC41
GQASVHGFFFAQIVGRLVGVAARGDPVRARRCGRAARLRRRGGRAGAGRAVTARPAVGRGLHEGTTRLRGHG